MPELLDLIKDNFVEVLIAIVFVAIAIPISVIMVGGRIKIWKITMDRPKADKTRTIPDNDYDTVDVITTVVAITARYGRIEVTLKEAGRFAEMFYGMDTDSAQTHLISKSGTELMRLLTPLMEPEDLDALEKDQAELFDNVRNGKPAHAKVPVIFKSTHPHFSNAAYLPVIVNRGKSKKSKDGLSERRVQIVYLNLKHFEIPMKRYEQSKER